MGNLHAPFVTCLYSRWRPHRSMLCMRMKVMACGRERLTLWRKWSLRLWDSPVASARRPFVRRLPAGMQLQLWSPQPARPEGPESRSEEHTSELQSQMRLAYAVFCLKKTNHIWAQLHTCNTHTHGIHATPTIR